MLKWRPFRSKTFARKLVLALASVQYQGPMRHKSPFFGVFNFSAFPWRIALRKKTTLVPFKGFCVF